MNVNVSILLKILKRMKRRRLLTKEGPSWKEIYLNKNHHLPKIIEFIERYPKKENVLNIIESYIKNGSVIYVPPIYERVAQLYMCDFLERKKIKRLPLVIRKESHINKILKNVANGECFCTHLDIKDYFGSITSNHVDDLLVKYFDIEKEYLKVLDNMLHFKEKNKGFLIGFPLHTYIADQILICVDQIVEKNTVRFHDDWFIIHGAGEYPEFEIKKIQGILDKLGFLINHKKTKTLGLPATLHDFL